MHIFIDEISIPVILGLSVYAIVVFFIVIANLAYKKRLEKYTDAEFFINPKGVQHLKKQNAKLNKNLGEILYKIETSKMFQKLKSDFGTVEIKIGNILSKSVWTLKDEDITFKTDKALTTINEYKSD